MRTVRIHAFGGPEVLRLEDIPVPRPRAHELLVKVQAAGVGRADCKLRAGQDPAINDAALPLVLGRDVSGIVAECGDGAAYFRPGDPVYAMLGPHGGGYGEFVCVPENEAALKPASLDAMTAAAVPFAALAAWQALFDHGGLEAGQRVLVHGGAGGVGHFAVQLAKAKGAWVACTVSAGDVGFVRGLGVDQAIDYRTQRFEDGLQGIDLILDLVGGETQRRSWSVLRAGGRLVSSVGVDEEPLARHPAALVAYRTRPDASQLQTIGQLIDERTLRPFLEASFLLDEARMAHERLENTHLRGKIILLTQSSGVRGV